MKTAQTHHTLLFNPNRFAILHRDGVHRTLFGTETAAHTTIFHMKMVGRSLLVIGLIIPLGQKARSFMLHHVTVCFVLDLINYGID